MRNLVVLVLLCAAAQTNAQYLYNGGKLDTAVIGDQMKIWYSIPPELVIQDTAVIDSSILYYQCDPNASSFYEVKFGINDTVTVEARGYLNFFARGLSNIPQTPWTPAYGTTPLVTVPVTSPGIVYEGPLSPKVAVEVGANPFSESTKTISVEVSTPTSRVIVYGPYGQVHYSNHNQSNYQVTFPAQAVGQYLVVIRGFYPSCEGMTTWKYKLIKS